MNTNYSCDYKNMLNSDLTDPENFTKIITEIDSYKNVVNKYNLNECISDNDKIRIDKIITKVKDIVKPIELNEFELFSNTFIGLIFALQKTNNEHIKQIEKLNSDLKEYIESNSYKDKIIRQNEDRSNVRLKSWINNNSDLLDKIKVLESTINEKNKCSLVDKQKYSVLSLKSLEQDEIIEKKNKEIKLLEDKINKIKNKFNNDLVSQKKNSTNYIKDIEKITKETIELKSEIYNLNIKYKELQSKFNEVINDNKNFKSENNKLNLDKNILNENFILKNKEFDDFNCEYNKLRDKFIECESKYIISEKLNEQFKNELDKNTELICQLKKTIRKQIKIPEKYINKSNNDELINSVEIDTKNSVFYTEYPTLQYNKPQYINLTQTYYSQPNYNQLYYQNAGYIQNSNNFPIIMDYDQYSQILYNNY